MVNSIDTTIFAPAPFCVSRFHKETNCVELVSIGPKMQVYSIDGVCAFVWRQLDGETSLGQIVNRTVKEFEVSTARAKKDIEAFIDELLQLDLILER